MIVNSLAWIYYAWAILEPPQYGLIPSAAVNFVISCAAAWKWFREDRPSHRTGDDLAAGHD